MSLVDASSFSAIVEQVSFAVTVWVRFREQKLVSTNQSSPHMMDKEGCLLPREDCAASGSRLAETNRCEECQDGRGYFYCSTHIR